MLKIAVCDDVAADLDQLTQMLRTYSALHPEYEAAIFSCSSPLTLLSEIEGGRWHDIYLLDIVMPQLSGLQLAQMIRQRNNACAIIFGSITSEYAWESYGVQALNYLVKPFQQPSLFATLDRSVASIALEQASGITIRTTGGQVFLSFYQISYIELAERSMVFHLRNGQTITSLKLRGSFEAALAKLLADPRFLQPHKSFIVNMDDICLQTNHTLLLRDHTTVAVSARRLSSVVSQYLAYRSQRKG